MRKAITESQLKKLQELNYDLEFTVKAMYNCIDKKQNDLFTKLYTIYLTQKLKWESAAKCGYKNPEITEYAQSLNI